jgi:hypothetical protein
MRVQINGVKPCPPGFGFRKLQESPANPLPAKLFEPIQLAIVPYPNNEDLYQQLFRFDLVEPKFQPYFFLPIAHRAGTDLDVTAMFPGFNNKSFIVALIFHRKTDGRKV